MKQWYRLVILFALVSFTLVTGILEDQEGNLKYGALFCLAFIILALAKIFIRPPGETKDP